MSAKSYQTPEDFVAGVISVTASIAAEDTFSDTIEVKPGDRFNVSVSGSFVAIVTLQRSFDDGSTWKDVWFTDSAAAERTAISYEKGVIWRIGIKDDEYTSGTAAVRISQ